jgi:SAM-dependent MidA family methyltransferase
LNPLVEIITREAAASGVLPFSRFMELALYCPDYGFYEREKDNIGRRGDFYTSVSVGPLFGQILAFQFAEWLENEARNQRSEIRIVEAGAHDGKLAGDILGWLQSRRSGLFAQIEYCIIEPSARRQAWQRETLSNFSGQVRWFSALDDLGDVRGVIFSNELLDAFPVHRLGWDAVAKTWFEWGVSVSDGKFVWERMPQGGIQNPEFRIQNLPEDVLAVLPDGFTTEICPAAEDWWRTAAGVLQRGKLLTLDYGLTAEEFFQPGRSQGTLRTYRRHQAGEDLLSNVGEHDITAHVNFTAIQSAGEAAGLKTEAFVAQSKFLTEIAGKIWMTPQSFGEWTAADTRQFQTLTHPEHLGRPFRALVQSKPG